MLWIKMYPAKCLRGSLHFDIPFNRRGIWYELLLMAGDLDKDGLIDYPLKFVANQLGCPLKVLEEVLAVLEKTERIHLGKGRILISKWNLYQTIKGKPHVVKKRKKSAPQDGPFGGVTNDQYQEDYLTSADALEDAQGSKIPAPPDDLIYQD